MTTTIVKKEEPIEKGIFYAGNMVNYNGIIVVVEHSLVGNNFSGTVLHCEKSSLYHIGYHSGFWRKDTFSQFIGEITLKCTV